MPAVTHETYEGTGERLPEAQDTRNHLPMKPRKIRAPFTLCHIPSRWQWSSDDGWFPSLTQITHKAGCNGVEAYGSGENARINPLPAITGHQSVKGATIIDNKDQRLPGGQPKGQYLLRHRCTNGQWHHTLRFESWTRIGNGKLRKRFDTKGHMKWLRELEKAGFIPPMAEEVLEDKLEILEKRINRLQNDRVGNAAVTIGLEKATKQRDQMTADWQKQYGEKPKAKAKE